MRAGGTEILGVELVSLMLFWMGLGMLSRLVLASDFANIQTAH